MPGHCRWSLSGRPRCPIQATLLDGPCFAKQINSSAEAGAHGSGPESQEGLQTCQRSDEAAVGREVEVLLMRDYLGRENLEKNPFQNFSRHASFTSEQSKPPQKLKSKEPEAGRKCARGSDARMAAGLSHATARIVGGARGHC